MTDPGGRRAGPLDRRALAELYERYGYAVHRRCLRLLGSRAEADDALQEVFVRVMRYGHTLHDDQAPLAWLYRIAERHCFDALRRRGRDAPAPGPDDAPAEEAPAADGPAPERARLVSAVLATCRPEVQRAAVLYYVDELTQDEVAAALGCSRKTVKARLARFRDRARGLLGDRAEEEA